MKKKHRTDKVTNSGEVINPNAKWMGIFILVIMVLSVFGFAFSMGGGAPSSEPHNQLPDELDLQYFESHGEGAWIAVKNKEVFIFPEIESYENDTHLLAIADRIKSSESLNIYYEPSFSSPESVFLIDKVMRGLEIETIRVEEPVCDEKTLYITDNSLFNGNCIIFMVSSNGTYQMTESLVYHLVK